MATQSTGDPMVHLAALAYMSDELTLGPALFANPEAVIPKIRNVVMATSMNHNVSLHDSNARADE